MGTADPQICTQSERQFTMRQRSSTPFSQGVVRSGHCAMNKLPRTGFSAANKAANLGRVVIGGKLLTETVKKRLLAGRGREESCKTI